MFTTKSLIPFHELDLPSTVYKYRRWDNSNHRKLLTDAELMFDNPFNMDAGSELKHRTQRLTGGELRKFYENRAKVEFPRLNKHEQFNKARDGFKFSKFKDPRKVEVEVEDLIKQYNDKFGVLCLGQTNDNPYLWNHYGSSGYGFCVGIKPKRLVTEPLFFGGVVQYYPPNEEPIIRFPSIDPQDYSDDCLNLFLSLPENVKHEGEYRIGKEFSGAIKVEKSVITEVIIGYAMNADQEREVINKVSENLPDALIFRSDLNAGNITVRRLNN